MSRTKILLLVFLVAFAVSLSYFIYKKNQFDDGIRNYVVIPVEVRLEAAGPKVQGNHRLQIGFTGVVSRLFLETFLTYEARRIASLSLKQKRAVIEYYRIRPLADTQLLTLEFLHRRNNKNSDDESQLQEQLHVIERSLLVTSQFTFGNEVGSLVNHDAELAPVKVNFGEARVLKSEDLMLPGAIVSWVIAVITAMITGICVAGGAGILLPPFLRRQTMGEAEENRGH